VGWGERQPRAAAARRGGPGPAAQALAGPHAGAGLLLFRERLSALQVFGICVAVTGLTLVSMSTRVA